MLGAVPVVAADADADHPLDLVGLGLACGEADGVAIDLEATASGVIHQEQRHPGILAQMSHGEQLAVAAEIGEGQGVRIEQAQEAHGAAPMLNVGGAVLGEAGDVEAVARGDEGRLLRAERIRSRGGRHRLSTAIGPLLLGKHGGGEVTLQVVLRHLGPHGAEASQHFNPPQPGVHVSIGAQIDLAVGGEMDVGVDGHIGDGGTAERQPGLDGEMLIQQAQHRLRLLPGALDVDAAHPQQVMEAGTVQGPA